VVMIRKALTGTAAVSFMTALLCVGAQAQTTASLMALSSIQTDGLTFTITSCSFTAQNSATGVACNPGATGNLPAGDEIMAVVNNGGASLEVVNANGGPVMSIVSNGGNMPSSHNFDDLFMTFNVTPTNSGSKTTISSLSTAVSGTASQTSGLSDITAGLVVTDGSSTYPLTSAADGTTTGPITFPGTNSLSVNYDLKLNATGTADTLSLTNVSSIYSPAPEPASLALLGSATLMLGRLRKRRRNASGSV
jgi:hypothetical protein